ncbi:MAG: PSD1 domain-containing protein [Verrucomicrobia bacterium]|nr:PSD1 domain-containing protein [Verrucomicrobiota bacterium]
MKAAQTILPLVAAALSASAATAEIPTPQQLDFFEKKIRPVLVEHCYKCHSATSEKIKGGLTLDTREGLLRGGETGPAIVPGDAGKSLLIEAIRYANPDLAMPPKKEGGKLPEAVIRDFEAWVKMGAPDPRGGAAATVVKKYDTSNAKSWWSYQPLRKAAVPQPKNSAWAKTDIDRFVLDGLEAKGLKPVADAELLTLVRRIYFDLTGLPPTPEEMDAVAKSAIGNRQLAIEQLVDRLLASPRFGEHWGRHWLDVARYAESSGRDENVTFPNAWRYRDYVVSALNRDKPYDRFILEQIAGDLLPTSNAAARAENLIATGFLAVGAKSLNETMPKQFAVDLADEQVSAVGQAFLGQTIGCARCHDHKFDPLSQRDYTALAGIFLSTDTRYGTPGGVQGRNLGSLLELTPDAALPVVARPMSATEHQRKSERRDSLRAELRGILAARAPDNPNRDKAMSEMSAFDVVRVFTQVATLDAELVNYDETGKPKTLAMGARDRSLTSAARTDGKAKGKGKGMPSPGRGRQSSGFETIADAPLFARGDVNKPGDPVPRALPALFASVRAPAIPKSASGRLELAQWMVSPQNPLTSRVIVNRTWHWLFGRGLVASVDNFGTTGERPSNAELLDFLAAKFVADGWSVKKLVRSIVLSRAYQLASTHDDASFAADPDNVLLWRHSPHRLEAESIRDAMLAAAGALDLRPQAGSVIGRAGDGPIGGPRNRAMTEEQVAKADHDARSLYLPIARNVPPEVLAVFDLPDASDVHGAREITNVPAQALFLLNSEFVAKQSRRLAERVLKAHPGGAMEKFEERFTLACRLAFARVPDKTELDAARSLLAKKSGDATAAWTSLARALFASAEFRHLN